VVPASSPENVRGVRLEAAITGNDGETLGRCLGEQHAVEGIAMVEGQSTGALGMVEGHDELLEATFFDAGSESVG